MTYQKLFLILFFGIALSTARAQPGHENILNSEKAPFKKEFVGRINFLGMLDGFDRNVSIGAEYQFSHQWAAGLDAAYIFWSEYVHRNNGARGVILRPFIRYYFKEKRTGFLEAHFHYKKVAYKVKDWIGRDVVNGVPAYEEFSTFDFNKRVMGFSFLIGDKFNLSKDKKVKFEPYIGLGLRFKKQVSENGTYSPGRRSFFDPAFEPDFMYTALPMGIRVVVRL